ncbi:dTDP-4-dehydrorhamnose 3,5-epimerase [Undibacterium sp.]|uniref:dTDP-4-dehydrorhamnose 3,5-epimerase n=1 Tax=Undibacterium sp. TaxID=1914977 RepID=UPI0025FA5F29|nr:dTDP-4-dehydrorhamnose 3,5-epimerase [Undibacterium sp.]
MQITPTQLPGVLIIEPKVFSDGRGFFYESFNAKNFNELTALNVQFVQDNHSLSVKNVLRGLHYQIHNTQGKLVRVTHGEVFDVVVDLRKHSPYFGNWIGTTLSAKNHRQLWIPQGFAHGFLVTSDQAEFLYKTTDYWAPEHERCLRWDDPSIGIIWPLSGDPIVSAKDQQGKLLADTEIFK